jgi:hypothetical protein
MKIKVLFEPKKNIESRRKNDRKFLKTCHKTSKSKLRNIWAPQANIHLFSLLALFDADQKEGKKSVGLS